MRKVIFKIDDKEYFRRELEKENVPNDIKERFYLSVIKRNQITYISRKNIDIKKKS